MKAWFGRALTTSLAAAVSGAVLSAADTPVAGLFNANREVTPVSVPVTASATKVGETNSRGEAIFNLKNASSRPLTSVLVAIDFDAPPDAAKYTCSTLSEVLPTCRTGSKGNTLFLLFSGAQPIPADGLFKLGFASSNKGEGWPAHQSISVTANGQLPGAGS
jgi:hypothetical protein